jgi:hypothetical protein
VGRGQGKNQPSSSLAVHASVGENVSAIVDRSKDNTRRTYRDEHIYTCSDSQSALRARKVPRVMSKLVWE